MSSIGQIVRKNHSEVFWCTRHYPKAKRAAVYTIYALMNHFDELRTCSLPRKEKAEILEAWRRELVNIYDKKVPETAIGRRIYKNCLRFKLARESFETILDAFMKDCPTPLCCPTREEFEQYCYGVAEVPAYLILRIIAEFDEENTLKLARSIGRAVEMTNILKNVKEDMYNGHVYIPREYLEAAGVDPTLSPREILTHTKLWLARKSMADEVNSLFEESYSLLEEIHNKNSKPIIYMLNLYHTYFQLMDKRGWEIISPKPKITLSNRVRLIFKVLFGHGA